MTLITAILAYALLTGYLYYRSASLRARLGIWATNAPLQAQILAATTVRNVRTFVLCLFLTVVAFVIALIAAVAWGNPVFLFVVLGTSASLAFTAMYAFYQVHKGLNTAADKLKEAGKLIWDNVPVFLLPLKLVGGILLLIGNELASPLANSAKWMATVMAEVIVLPLLLLAGFALLDLQLGWTIINPFTLMILGFVWMTIVTTQVILKTRPSLGVSLLGIITVVVLFFSLVVQYVSPGMAWYYLTFYITYALAICIALQLVLIRHSFPKGDAGGHGHQATPSHPVRRILGLVIGSFFVWFVLYPLITGDRPGYFWAQREATFRLARLHAVNRLQLQDQTNPGIVAAEGSRKVPNYTDMRKDFVPWGERANQIEMVKKEAEAAAAGELTKQAPLFVDAKNPQWQGHIVFEGPLMLYGISGHSETDSGVGTFTSTPDGIQKPKGLKYYPLPLADDQLHLALIGRVCEQSGCTEPFFVGSAKTFCPTQVGRTGWIELKVNQNNTLFHDNEGGYNYNHKPAPSAACP